MIVQALICLNLEEVEASREMGERLGCRMANVPVPELSYTEFGFHLSDVKRYFLSTDNDNNPTINIVFSDGDEWQVSYKEQLHKELKKAIKSDE